MHLYFNLKHGHFFCSVFLWSSARSPWSFAFFPSHFIPLLHCNIVSCKPIWFCIVCYYFLFWYIISSCLSLGLVFTLLSFIRCTMAWVEWASSLFVFVWLFYFYWTVKAYKNMLFAYWLLLPPISRAGFSSNGGVACDINYYSYQFLPVGSGRRLAQWLHLILRLVFSFVSFTRFGHTLGYIRCISFPRLLLLFWRG